MFNDVAMVLRKEVSGWNVAPVKIERVGGFERYSVAANAPREATGADLPVGMPFRCSVPANVGGIMVAQLVFEPTLVTPWHNDVLDPFDPNLTIVLTMDVVGVGQEDLRVVLSCARMPHLQPKRLLLAVVQAVVTLAVTIALFFKHLFVAKRHRLAVEDEAELAADGPEGVGKEFRG